MPQIDHTEQNPCQFIFHSLTALSINLYRIYDNVYTKAPECVDIMSRTS